MRHRDKTENKEIIEYMRRRKRKDLPTALLLCLGFLMIGLLAGCGDEGEESAVTRVSVILPHNNDSYWDVVAGGINDAYLIAQESTNIDIRTMVPQINYSTEQMTDLLNQQIAAGVDILVVQGSEDEMFKSALIKAYDAGIRIICMDTDEEDFPEHIYVGTNNYEAGRLLGNGLLTLAGEEGTGKVKVISGEPYYSNMQLRLQGLTDVLSGSGIEICEVVYDHYDGLTVMKEYEEDTEADLLACLEGTGLQTIARMKTEHGDKYRYIVGFDDTECLKNHTADGVLVQDMEGIGQTVVEEIIRITGGEDTMAAEIYTPIQWVTEAVE